MKFLITLLLLTTSSLIFAQNDTIVPQEAQIVTDTITSSETSIETEAETDTQDETQAEAAPEKLKLSGFLELDHISYFKQRDDKINSRNQGIFQLIADHKINSKFNFHSAVEMRNDQSDSARNRIFIDEAFIDYSSKDFDIRLGKQLITWGTADGINPTNNINPIDYSDILDTDDERIGSIALQTKYYLGDFTLEADFLPIYNSSVLPTQNSRWFTDLDPQIILPDGTPINANYTFSETKLPKNDIRSAQFALKLSTVFKGWDLSMSYYNGFDDLPSFNKDVTFAGDFSSAAITIKPEIKKLQVYGFDFSKAAGKFGLRGEAAYFQTEDKKGTIDYIDNPFFWYVVGIDRDFSNVIGENNLFVLLQWVNILAAKGDLPPNTNMNAIFQKSVVSKIDLELNSISKLSLQATYDFTAKNYYVQPQYSRQIADGLNLNVFVDCLGGKKNTFFGNYDKNDRIQVRLKYSF
ncbi:DUF1302 domain-containing protein [Flavobacterium sp. H122]|uniref:DUF1302 domain-containing protein n=1 Tax=Flavobacterium sp. H122 TaxID=2529860 RepID=UPI0010AA0C4D|nr:DUF1302 domain-containing protein [Flavobacterium sp. H122]